MAKGQNFVGFYWTQPEPFAGFIRLSENDAEEAEKQSRTIRYQRHLTNNHVQKVGGRLVGEYVLMDVTHDYRSDIRFAPLPTPLEKAVNKCRQKRAALLYVEFWIRRNARAHATIISYLDEIDKRGIKTVGLEPTEISIDGFQFDPLSHFREWREKRAANAQRKQQLTQEIERTIGWLAVEHPVGTGRYRKIADELNRKGVKTKTGKLWTPKNVEVFMGRSMERRRKK